VGRVDILFTSEALNLADFFRLMPSLLKKPAVVYFHSNQLPAQDDISANPLDIVNLNTAAAAHETWFNSLFHVQDFLEKAASLVMRTPELHNRNPMNGLMGKAQLMYPPIDFQLVHHYAANPPPRRPRAMFVDTRDADIKLLNSGLATLKRRGEAFELFTV